MSDCNRFFSFRHLASLALLFSLFTFHFSLECASAAPAAAAHSLHLSRDLRTATLATVAPDPGDPSAFAVLARRPSLPVTVAWLYDGALPDAFPRNPRTDPAFRRDSSPAVSTLVSFDWPAGVPPLPGPVRFFDGEADTFLRCLGTLPLPPDAAPGVPLSFALPSAFGLSATRVQTAFRLAPDRSSAVESYEIVLRNDTPAAVPVTVLEHLLRSPDWELAACSVPQTRDPDASLLRLETTVPPRASRTLSFTVRYAFPTP